ncbi:hypothetical protein Q1695_007518 [Nippostrongylus brasiliensis]|nr:hypothetical protein Q1695_007518 [Nippostrongylus brasiliensis]
MLHRILQWKKSQSKSKTQSVDVLDAAKKLQKSSEDWAPYGDASRATTRPTHHPQLAINFNGIRLGRSPQPSSRGAPHMALTAGRHESSCTDRELNWTEE